MPKTAAQRLEEIDAAITAIHERGQQWAIRDRSGRRANLADLERMRVKAQVDADREADGKPRGRRMRFGMPK